jgi:hypothetical protein
MVTKQAFKKDVGLGTDGSVNLHMHPSDFLKDQDEDARPQVLVRAEKKEEGEDVGVAFKKIGENLYVSGIASGSMFLERGFLELGDRICAVNDTNFMDYADAAFATKLLNKSTVMKCEMYVEKGWNALNIPDDVDPCHFDKNLGKSKPKAAAAPVPESKSEEVAEPEPKKKEKAAPPPPKKKEEESGEVKMWWDE